MNKKCNKIYIDNQLKLKLLFILISTVIILSLVFPKIVGAQEKKEDFKKYWPSKSQAKIKFIRSVSHAKQFKKKEGFFGKIANFIFGSKDAAVHLQRPWGINAIENKLYIADPATKAVYKVDFNEKRMQKFLYSEEGSFFSGTGEEYFNTPIDVVATDDGKIFVSDSTRQEVLVFSQDGKLIKKLGSGRLKRPTGLGIAPKNNWLYVADTTESKIYIYNTKNYKLIKSLGKKGGEKGEFNYPIDIFVRNEKVYISDAMNFRVQILDLDGNFISEFGHLGDGSGDFARPKGVAVDSDGHIYVVDALFGVVQIFNEQGQLLLTLGQEGRNLGEFWLPTGIYIDKQDKIYVADSYNHRVQIFKYLGK